ncbi:right-handed parallel beta-helix repeat-containing protein [candidate division WOR-3 bacterium]|nr:right-handed parallel beta-helix repeat-containing protein [candidate division WOR-3 bacterium]
MTRRCLHVVIGLSSLVIAGCGVRRHTRPFQPAPAGRLLVAQDGSTRFPTISAALDSARDGDTVFVMPGEYHEAVKVARLRRITLLGADPATTVVNATGQYAAVELRTDSNRVSGLTLRNADSHGIWVRDGQQFIDHCVIASNGDRGVYLSSFAGFAYAHITHCTVVDNDEVGIHAARDDSSTVIADCIVAFNPRGIVTDQPKGKIAVRRNCLFGNGLDFDRVAPGDGSILRDPLFEDRARGDYSLRRGSPCIGADSTGANIGAL